MSPLGAPAVAASLVAAWAPGGPLLALVAWAALAVVLVVVPGAIVLDLARVRARALDDLALSLVAGTGAAALVYWLAGWLDARAAFVLWPLACLVAAARTWPRQRERLLALRAAVRRPATLVPLSVVALSLLPLTFLPLYYANLAPLADGGFRFYALPDLVLHASMSQEVTHSIPPAIPFLPGQATSYHYTMDVLPAVFAAFGAALTDGCVRIVPTLLTVTTALVLFAAARDWLGSTSGAALASLLVLFGEDFSWIPGALRGDGVPWSTAYFGMPTTASLYMLNPMLPALGVLAAVLLCLRYAQRGEKGGWLALAAGFVLLLAHYKVFTAAHLLAALGLAGVVAWARERDGRLLVFVAACGLLLLPSALLMGRGAGAPRVRFLLEPWPYVPGFLVRTGLWDAPWLAPLRALVTDGFDVLGLVEFVFVGLLPYLVGSFGVRVLALPVIVRALREDPFRVAMAVFVLLGPIVTLTCAIVVPGVPPSQQYNNSVWFYVQAKYLAWMFVVEVLRRATARLSPAGKALAWAAALFAAFASGVQYFGYQLAVREEGRLSPALVEVVDRVGEHARPGDVVWAREYVTQPLVALGRVHGLSLEVFPYVVLEPAAIADTRAVQDGFWARWHAGGFDPEPLVAWRARYVVADRLDGPLPPGARSGSRVWLRPFLENGEFAVYEVVRPGAD
jgi:hypothetical protein